MRRSKQFWKRKHPNTDEREQMIPKQQIQVIAIIISTNIKRRKYIYDKHTST